MVSLEPSLVALARKQGASSKAADLSTAEFGRLLDVSQQTASRYLKELETMGLVERARSRRGFTIKITSEGISVLRRIRSDIGSFLDPEVKTTFQGTIESGIGEGAYYVGEYASRIQDAVGYKPFPGTLNVRFKGEKPDMNTDRTIDIPGFDSGGRSFGRVGLTPVTLHVGGKTIACHVIIPERTHHHRDIELVAKDNIRKKYRLKDGDKATLILGGD
jgi:riboflavin kinase, archaea type